MANIHKDTDIHKLLKIPMGDVRKLVDKLVELRFVPDRDEWMRTHTNPLKVFLYGVMVDFNDIIDVDFAVHACSCIGYGRSEMSKSYADKLIASESPNGLKVTKAIKKKMEKANAEFLDRHPDLKKTFSK